MVDFFKTISSVSAELTGQASLFDRATSVSANSRLFESLAPWVGSSRALQRRKTWVYPYAPLATLAKQRDGRSVFRRFKSPGGSADTGSA